MQKDTTLDWCHNYMSEFFIVLFKNSHKHFANVIGKLRMIANIHGAKEHETRN
jgi:hypothetical protein